VVIRRESSFLDGTVQNQKSISGGDVVSHSVNFKEREEANFSLLLFYFSYS
jgi:hypothetical protein